MRSFERAGTDGFVAVVDPAERAVLLDVVDEVLALLDGEDPGRGAGEDPLDHLRVSATPVVPPWDPALRRLLPDASRDDPEVTAEFRRLTEADLRSTKTANLLRLRSVVQGAAPELLVLPSEADAVAAALTDLRLVVSERLGVRTDADADALYTLVGGRLQDEQELDEAEDRRRAAHRFLATVYVVLSVLQESLVGLMLEDLPGTDPAEPSGRPGP